MQDLAIFTIASQRNRWLAARSAAISANIANADTPGFRAQDVAPFEAALESAAIGPTRTNVGHLIPSGPGANRFDVIAREDSVHKHSGNTVNIEAEMMQLGDVRSQHSMLAGVVSIFHRMLLQVSKG